MENVKKELGILGLSKQTIEIVLAAIPLIGAYPEIYSALNKVSMEAQELKQLKGGLAELAATALRQPLKPGPKKEKNPGGIVRTKNEAPAAEGKEVKLKPQPDAVKDEAPKAEPKRKPGREKTPAAEVVPDGPAEGDDLGEIQM